jgi:rod shape determining protein RodA
MSVRTIQPSASELARGRRTGSLRARLLTFDPLLALAAAGLAVCSLIALHGVAPQYTARQGAYLGLGFVLMLALSRFDYWWLRDFKWPIYGALILAILLVITLGSSVNGSSRAIAIGGVSFQASEFGKVALIVFLAALVADTPRRESASATTLRVLAFAIVPALLVIKEPDLGSGLVYLVIAFAVLYVAGIPARQLGIVAGAGIGALLFALVVAPALGIHLLDTYQEQRLTGFLSPSQNPSSHAYQQVQSVIAIGSGQQTGRGAAATQTSLGLVSEAPTDFIFTVVGERLGFMGAAIVMSLYALMIWRTLRIVATAKNLFAALIAGGVVAMIMFQVFVNVGMTIGIMPITGVTLPLMSYGGSSVLTTFLTLGLLQSIYGRARVANASGGRLLRF